jgi:hypothetical protein
MDKLVSADSAVTDTLDPALRGVVEHLLSDTVKRPCYRDVCRQNHANPDAIYRLIDGLSHQLQAKDEQIKTQAKTIDRLRFQLIKLIRECTARDGGPGLQ